MTGDAVAQEITEIIMRRPGDRIVYHRGHLAYDRGQEEQKRSDEERKVNETANIAWKLWQAGKVHLLQRRVAKDTWDYIAERRP